MQVSLLGSARMIAPQRGAEPDVAVRQSDIVLMAKDNLPGGTIGGQPLVGDLMRPAEVDRDIAFAR